MAKSFSDDHEKILNHIHGIFKAFLSKDREAIKQAHSDDWTGFMGPSTGIERGIDSYMTHVDNSLENFNGVSYKIFDSEIQIYDRIAIVYYVAEYNYEDEDKQIHSIPLRSVDIYRRESDDWIQAGSHITPIPTDGNWGQDENK